METVHRIALLAIACIGCGRVGFDGLGDDDDGQGGGSADAAGSGTGDGSQSSGSFGSTTVGGSTQMSGNNRVWITSATLAEPAMVNTLVVHLGVSVAATTARGLIYSDSSGAPSTWVASTNEVALPFGTPQDWVTFAFASPVALAPGTYWLGTQNASAIDIQFDGQAGTTKFANDVYSDGANLSFGTGTSIVATLSIYAVYTR